MSLVSYRNYSSSKRSKEYDADVSFCLLSKRVANTSADRHTVVTIHDLIRNTGTGFHDMWTKHARRQAEIRVFICCLIQKTSPIASKNVSFGL